MTNVVSLRRTAVSPDKAAVPALIEMVATRRRGRHDPFWLKENAELLQVLAATSVRPSPSALAPLVDQLGDLEAELAFFPQYYRMLLSIAVDLRDLGVEPVSVQRLGDYIQRQRLPLVEVSDMQRAEVDLLLQRAGCVVAPDAGQQARLWAFAKRAENFALPNRRAAYDLTHIVFHASDYGRRPLPQGQDLRDSLIFAGMVAWLEGNLDLLAEVVIALRMTGQSAPEIWQTAVIAAASDVRFVSATGASGLDDAYHQVLVLNWAASVSGRLGFDFDVPADARLVLQSLRPVHALTEMSYALLSLGADRTADWARMRWRIWSKLSPDSRSRIEMIETWPEFERFFATFARPMQTGGAR